ncbi:uncharacterized protein LOC113315452 [Papaver somniferum]|uniref:uncharacterized protein LOC113315452 n=1 Tax=Papaver somniferum TaxID=3469 RepID=UPI000E6FC220|nr:uncharacterized protein LOC113315452 [Papaver somniferum]
MSNYTENLKLVNENISKLTMKFDEILSNLQEDLKMRDAARKEDNTARDAQTTSAEDDGSAHEGRQQTPRTTAILDTPPRIQLKFPTFDGTDPDGWIFQAEQYFTWHVIATNHKVNLAAAHLKGEANAWFRWKRTQIQILSWVTFCTQIRERFQPNFVDPKIAISTIKQKGSVKDFLPEFESLLNQVDFPESHLINLFTMALKPEVGNMVKLLEPTSLSSAFKKALNQDEVLSTSKPPWRFNQSRPIQASTTSQFKKPLLPMGKKLLTIEEQRERQAKGLCYNCDEQYKRGHVYVQPRLLVLEVDPSTVDEKEDKPNEEVAEEEFKTTESFQDPVQPAISLHSLMGSSFPKTMRLDGYTKSQPLRILIDSGSTHNFLLPRWANHCGYPVSSADKALQVTVGNGTQLPTKGYCPKVQLTLQNHSFTIDFHLLEIGGYDAVLGVQWLRTLGPIIWDFSKLTMQFTINDSAVLLQGNNYSSVMMMDSVPMQNLLCRESYAIILQLFAITKDSVPPEAITSPALKALLQQYADIFRTPTSLPPERLQDHRIPLIGGATPVNIRPYRYPYFQKTEIEKIVSELQQAGFIKPSSSPYSSPILMVRKKDDSWPMCVDYHALNKITVKDRFPIPMVD